MRCDNPDCRGAALVVLICIIVLFLSTIFIARSIDHHFREVEIDPPVVTHLVDEGVAKAALILQLTGHTVAPEYAQYVNINITVSKDLRR